MTRFKYSISAHLGDTTKKLDGSVQILCNNVPISAFSLTLSDFTYVKCTVCS
jgi:hypothetical protein